MRPIIDSKKDMSNPGHITVKVLDLYGKEKEHTFKCEWFDWVKGVHLLHDGVMVQHALPTLTDGDREFLISGITPDEWEAMFGEEALGDEWEEEFENT